MGRILGNLRIPIAVLFSALLVGGAYFLARGVEHPASAEASTESALLQSIATKDSDNDGLPDWEESLYGTNPNNPDTNNLGMTDGQAVAKGLIVPKAVADAPAVGTTTATSLPGDPSIGPAPAEGTLTAAFSKTFFTLYLAAKQQNGGSDLSQGQMQQVADAALSQLSSSVAPAADFKTAQDLTLTSSGADAMRAFAVNAEAVMTKNRANSTKSEIYYLQDVAQNKDMTAIPHLASIAQGYKKAAAGLAVLPVPPELAATDLALVNAMARVSDAVSDFTKISTDPLATMLALQIYPQAALDMGNAFIQLAHIYAQSGVVFTTGTPGASFVNLILDVGAAQAATASSTP